MPWKGQSITSMSIVQCNLSCFAQCRRRSFSNEYWKIMSVGFLWAHGEGRSTFMFCTTKLVLWNQFINHHKMHSFQLFSIELHLLCSLHCLQRIYICVQAEFFGNSLNGLRFWEPSKHWHKFTMTFYLHTTVYPMHGKSLGSLWTRLRTMKI